MSDNCCDQENVLRCEYCFSVLNERVLDDDFGVPDDFKAWGLCAYCSKMMWQCVECGVIRIEQDDRGINYLGADICRSCQANEGENKPKCDCPTEAISLGCPYHDWGLVPPSEKSFEHMHGEVVVFTKANRTGLETSRLKETLESLRSAAKRRQDRLSVALKRYRLHRSRAA